MTEFDPTNQSEQDTTEHATPDKPLSWYQRNKDYMREKRKRDYAENKNGVRDKKAAARRASRAKERESQRAYLERNREKVNARRREYYNKNADKIKPSFRERYRSERDVYASKRLERKFGITLDEYNAMLSLQGGRCAICGTEPKEVDKHGNTRRLAVDHNHKTGKVRQLLCTPCNTSIGLVKEDAKTLLKMIDYIKRHGENNVNTVNLTLTLDELQAVVGLIDAGIKSVGLSGVKSAAAILIKLEAAVAEANAAEPKETE